MTKTAAERAELKRKAMHEFREMVVIFLYLAFFFCALVTYSMLLLNEFHVRYWNYAFALINALVITKVIMIGEYAKVGRKYEARALFLSAIWKALLFGLLVFGFHVVEEVIKRLLHGADISGATREIRVDELLGRSIVVFCTFIPLFAFREFRRVLGEDKFRALFFKRGTAGHIEPSQPAGYDFWVSLLRLVARLPRPSRTPQKSWPKRGLRNRTTTRKWRRVGVEILK